MIIKELNVKNFRNIENAEFSFSEKTNIIGGNNAQGKTNLMEAAACAVEKSFRTAKSSELLPKDKNVSGEIVVSFVVDAHPSKVNRLECIITEGGIERKINGISYKEGLKLYPQLKTVVFIPEDLYIVKGSPDARRELADETADMMNRIHRSMTGNYFRALKQKNSFISTLNSSYFTRSDVIQLSVWNEELAKAGVNVMCGRLKYFRLLSRYAEEYYLLLSDGGERLRMEYQSSVFTEGCDISQPEELLKEYIYMLNRDYEREITMGHTLVGVHRDDIAFYIDDRPAKDYASQGQIRSIAIALRLAQARMFGEKWGEAPVIVLDDVLSELDEKRRGFVLSHIVNSQIFITGCNKNDFKELENAEYWEAEAGKFKKLSK